MKIPQHGLLPRLVLIASAVGLAAALISCGSGDDPEPQEPTPAVSATSGQGNTLKVALLSSLDSYKFTLQIDGDGGPVASLSGGSGTFNVTGSYIKPDRQQTAIKAGDQTIQSVIVGNQQWTVSAAGVQGPLPTGPNSLVLANPILAFWDGGPLREIILEFECSGTTSTMNGVSARRCTLDKAGYEKVTKTWGDFLGGLVHQSYSRATAEVWMADAGVPVRIRLDVAGKDRNGADFDYKLALDVTDIGSTFEIIPPQ